MLLNFLLFVILVACVGWLFGEGMWSNAICLVNVVTAALLATNFWEPVADRIEGYFPTFTYVWDFLSLWALFVIFMVIFRLATDFLSRVKVRFLTIADRIGSAFFAAWIGWVMVCFTAFSLHLAPMGRTFLRGSFDPQQRQQATIAPDLLWLGFMQKVSLGQFCRTLTRQDSADYEPREQDYLKKDNTRTFDPCGEFIPKYASRRKNLEDYNSKRDAIRINERDFAEHGVK